MNHSVGQHGTVMIGSFVSESDKLSLQDVLILKRKVKLIKPPITKTDKETVGLITNPAYPDGKDYDMNYGKPGERPGTDKNIAAVPLPKTDPLTGEVIKQWKN